MNRRHLTSSVFSLRADRDFASIRSDDAPGTLQCIEWEQKLRTCKGLLDKSLRPRDLFPWQSSEGYRNDFDVDCLDTMIKLDVKCFSYGKHLARQTLTHRNFADTPRRIQRGWGAQGGGGGTPSHTEWWGPSHLLEGTQQTDGDVISFLASSDGTRTYKDIFFQNAWSTLEYAKAHPNENTRINLVEERKRYYQDKALRDRYQERLAKYGMDFSGFHVSDNEHTQESNLLGLFRW